ncbi:MAG: hypothetical protein EVA89_13125 [Sandaracinaceae bacterium]|nr:MAG: hypothetical protein EVA89_13125 [Sandaracinaceae bacterium]
MKIGEVLNAVYDADVGWRPSSGAIKPAHVANGLVRAIQGRRYDTTRLHEFVVWWRRGKKPDENRTFEALVGKHPHVFEGFVKDFDRTRRYTRGLLGGDGALFPSLSNSSFSLTNGLMVTADSNDRQLGLFAAALMGDPDDLDTLAAAVREASSAESPRDPLTALVWPLLDDSEPKEAGGGKPAERVTKALGKRHNAAFVAAMAEATQCLATHERVQGNRMRTLQRAVQFSCVATLTHAQALAAGGKLESRPPALMTLSGHRRTDVARASERSLELLYRGFDSWLAQRLAARIRKGRPLAKDAEPLPYDTADLRTIRPVLARIAPAKKGDTPSASVVRERTHYYKRARHLLGDEAEPADVLGRALVDSYTREFASSGGPRRFLQGLGCRVGLLYPHFAGRARQKRFRPSVPVLDMLVRACVPAGQSVSLTVFLQRLWERFGLIVGGRRDDSWDDAAVLAAHDLAVDTPDLVANTEQLIDELAAMGLARRYADAVSFIGDGHE